MGCRKFKGRQYYDDLTGQTHLPEELEEFAFVFDGEALELDLDEDNAAAFRAAMEPFVKAARRTSKSKVLATLPKGRRRHLQSVPSPAVEETESEPEGSTQECPSREKGESVEALSEPEGTQVPETPSDVSDSRAPEQPARPALSVVPRPNEIPHDWAPFAPDRRDDQAARVKKVRGWATARLVPSHETLTQGMFDEWQKFYREQAWLRL